MSFGAPRKRMCGGALIAKLGLKVIAGFPNRLASHGGQDKLPSPSEPNDSEGRCNWWKDGGWS